MNRSIETARLTMTPHGAADFNDLWALWRDPMVVANIAGAPIKRSDARARLLRRVGEWALEGWGFWAVRRKEDGAYLGEVGFLNAMRELDPPLPDMPEAGWVFNETGRGQGYAREAVGAMLAWADAHPAFDATCAMIAADNERSLKLAGEMGYDIAYRSTFNGDPVEVLTRPRRGLARSGDL
ncbi:GNAT family N-acetyltransferase [Pontivivens ytuae]|uniref:GNAT family N-acetyltransferase n=1 Tax=Pontivivens ytuae TaxID=2789856 RepID=A0A7S9LQK7_9RHOB|nr:GNAT family N-acetyltransferase [Pontivivens ytuae]QPH53170.1 GNAT family N-acetyltransferase [Pontivivens ytuae]